MPIFPILTGQLKSTSNVQVTEFMAETNNDRRQSHRHRCRQKLIVTLISGKRIQGALGINHSEFGLGIISGYGIKPRNYIMIRTVDDTAQTIADSIEPKISGSSVAEVRWCQESTVEKEPEYMMGVRYVHPYEY